MTRPADPDRTVTTGGWRGTTLLQPGRLAFTGSAGATDAHAHAAVQVLVVTHGVVELTDPHQVRRPVQAAIIPTRVRHALHAGPGARATMLYLDPAGSAGRRLTAHLTGPYHDRLEQWAAAARALLPPAGLRAADPPGDPARDPATLVRGWSTPARGGHPALQHAVRMLPQLLHGPVRLTDLAGRAGISASRLGYLFNAELALPFPACLRWARLRRAIELAAAGAGLTQAVHGAGFADSSHLTRVTREMFGLPPSQLLTALPCIPP
ncbi:AraC family transcriptional regulator [Streptomyces sp. NRRL WC-3549]|uniref:AraC family transcriptional regulator n=1 Tax=Streptomyces sp. NRRL WC-3549 TaxID=1463925 RepID=UPI00068D28FD|nr:AraC family transcriptional regulator [Streptomyces sp. NRRL WC-3549]